MALGKRKKQPKGKEVVAVPQTSASTHPFSSLSCYTVGSHTDTKLYTSLREAVPIIDAAINKIVRLIGTFRV